MEEKDKTMEMLVRESAQIGDDELRDVPKIPEEDPELEFMKEEEK